MVASNERISNRRSYGLDLLVKATELDAQHRMLREPSPGNSVASDSTIVLYDEEAPREVENPRQVKQGREIGSLGVNETLCAHQGRCEHDIAAAKAMALMLTGWGAPPVGSQSPKAKKERATEPALPASDAAQDAALQKRDSGDVSSWELHPRNEELLAEMGEDTESEEDVEGQATLKRRRVARRTL